MWYEPGAWSLTGNFVEVINDDFQEYSNLTKKRNLGHSNIHRPDARSLSMCYWVTLVFHWLNLGWICFSMTFYGFANSDGCKMHQFVALGIKYFVFTILTTNTKIPIICILILFTFFIKNLFV